MKNGKWWVLGMFVIGGGLSLIAVFYWKSPKNGVRQSFTLIHSLILRKLPEKAAKLVAPEVTWNGRTLRREEFMKDYGLPKEAGEIVVSPCPATARHWQVRMLEGAYCFVPDGNTWKLHWIGPAPCACR